MFGKLKDNGKVWELEVRVGRFNPRVRGTCLVRRGKVPAPGSVTLPCGVKKKEFQSPCAGNMFGKRKIFLPVRLDSVSSSFNPRVRGTCLVRIGCCLCRTQHRIHARFNPRVRGTCLVSRLSTNYRQRLG